jgi:glucose-6-phosphate dehydrogenase assembly protein OpcA
VAIEYNDDSGLSLFGSGEQRMSAAVATGASDPVPLGRVEFELSRRIRESMPANGTPLVQARLSNLVIYCQRQEQAETISQAIPEIVTFHPARVLLLVGDPSHEAPLEARLHVWTHIGGRQNICSEQVTLRAGGSSIDDFPFAARELLIGDLPVNVWWAVPTPPPLGGQLLFDLADRAQQLIYDSIGWPDPMKGLAVTSAWLEKMERGADLGRWRVAADLNWRRIRSWRRTLTEALDPNTLPGMLDSICEVLVEHGPHAVIQAMELVSWLASRLGWKVQCGKIIAGVEIVWQLAAPQGTIKIRIRRLSEGPSDLRKVRVTSNFKEGPLVVNVTVEKEMRLAVVLEGREMAPRTVAVQHPTLGGLVARQLSNRKRDPVFRASMAAAQTFARAVLS